MSVLTDALELFWKENPKGEPSETEWGLISQEKRNKYLERAVGMTDEEREKLQLERADRIIEESEGWPKEEEPKVE